MDELITEIKEDVLNVFDTVTGYFRRTKHRLQKLYDFLCLGWNDFDWDHEFLTNIILYKLRKMEEEHQFRGNGENSQQLAQLLRIARKSLYNWQKRRVNDKFVKEYLGFIPRIEMVFIDSRLAFKYYYPKTDSLLLPEDEKMYSEAISYAHKKERKYRRKYKRKFFKIMYENYERFWD